VYIQPSFVWPCPSSNRFFKHYITEAGSASVFRQDAPKLCALPHTSCHWILFSLYNLPEDFIPEEILETEKNPVTGSIRNRPTWHVYKIPSADPTLKYLPSGSLWSALKCLSNTFDLMKIRSFSTAGAGASVCVLWFCMRCLLSDQFEFIPLIAFSMVLICGVFQVIFLEYWGCF